MTDSAQPDPPLPADRTRDITLPPLPDRPPPALPKEWADLRPAVDAPTTAVPAPAAPPTAAAPPAAGSPPPVQPAAFPGPPPSPGTPPSPAMPPSPGISRDAAVARIEARMLAAQRTDEMPQPQPAQRRDRTLSFSSPEMRHRPVEPVAVGRTARRWPWVVLTLLPILVIVGAGIAWVLLLDGA